MGCFLASTALTLAAGAPGVALAQAAAEVEEIVVTGQRDHRDTAAGTASKMNVPLKDIPQSIQSVSEDLLRDRGPIRIDEIGQTADTRLDLLIANRLGRRNLQLNVQKATDENIWVADGYTLLPQAGRAAYLTLTTRFGADS